MDEHDQPLPVDGNEVMELPFALAVVAFEEGAPLSEIIRAFADGLDPQP